MNSPLKNKVKAVKEEKSFGHLNIHSKDFPDVSEFKLTETIELTVTLKVNSLRSPDRWEIAEQKMNPKDIMAAGTITAMKLAGK
jgi:hypothetical protein